MEDLYAYLGVLQIVGILLAFQTRKVKIPGLIKDSKFVAAVVYISSICPCGSGSRDIFTENLYQYQLRDKSFWNFHDDKCDPCI